MIFINLVVVCVTAFLFQYAVAQPPKFRILAPPFVCPKDKDAVIDKPDNTVVTLQAEAGLDVEYHWTVRWYPLVAPTQHFTLTLWRTVRELELKLNGPQIEPNVFVINNTELLSGVNYIFNVTATTPEDDVGTEQVFNIDNIKGDPKLMIEGRSEMFAILLIGGQMTYADIDFMLEAQVTTCYRTQDYYFVWTVTSAQDNVAVSDVKGSRLVIKANTLTPGQSYDVLCQVYKYSTGDFITQNSLPFRVLHRGLSINFNVDAMQISIETPLSLFTDITKLDYLEEGLTIAWECTFAGGSIDAYYETDDDGTLTFPSGLPEVGEYLIKLSVNVLGHTAADEAIVRIITVEPRLPTIKVLQMPRVLNEGSVATLKANVSDVPPGCSITWYFRSQHCLLSSFSSSTEICADSEHGTPISEPVNFYSLEENFLSELTDYTNETSWKSVSAELQAAAGRARLAVECGCMKEDNCTEDSVVYADVMFQLNHKPTMARSVMIMPDIGTAMETVFRLSTLAKVDPSRPLRYSFYCELNVNDTLLLGSYLEHLAVETFLPYAGEVTFVWVEVCDSLGACSQGDATMVLMSPGEARTVDALLEDVRAHVQRCELLFLRRVAASAVVTYTNAGQTEALTKFTSSLLDALKDIDENCIEKNYDQYYEFLYWLQNAGIDTTMLTQRTL